MTEEVTGGFSVGLLELALGGALLILALCTVLVVQFQIYPPLGFLPAFIAGPALFRGVASLQKRIPGTNDAAYSFPKYVVPLTFAVCIVVALLGVVLPEPFGGRALLLFTGLVVAAGLLLVNGGKRHVYVLAAASTALGAALTLLPNSMIGAAVYCAVFGLTLLLVGAASVRRNLKR